LCWGIILLGDELRNSGTDRKRIIHWRIGKYTHNFRLKARKEEAVSEVQD